MSLKSILLLVCSVIGLASITNITNQINGFFRIEILRNERVKNILYSEKYKLFRSKMKKTKNKAKSIYYKSLHEYYSLSEEERMMIDMITELLY